MIDLSLLYIEKNKIYICKCHQCYIPACQHFIMLAQLLKKIQNVYAVFDIGCGVFTQTRWHEHISGNQVSQNIFKFSRLLRLWMLQQFWNIIKIQLYVVNISLDSLKPTFHLTLPISELVILSLLRCRLSLEST